MRCEDVFEMALEEADAVESFAGFYVVAGLKIPVRNKISKFISIHHKELLSPTRRSFIVLKFSSFYENKLCNMFDKKCFNLSGFSMFIYIVDLSATLSKRFLRFL
jgi:hypothetical protein